MATKGTKYYNLQTKLEQSLKTVMLDNDCSLLQARGIINDVLGDAVDTMRVELGGLECPRCGEMELDPIEVRNALSRRDNETGLQILKAAHYGLEDSNFHSEAAMVECLADNLERVG
jgi:hypothetical protein